MEIKITLGYFLPCREIQIHKIAIRPKKNNRLSIAIVLLLSFNPPKNPVLD